MDDNYEKLLHKKSIIHRHDIIEIIYDSISEDIKNLSYQNIKSTTYDDYMKLMITFEYIWQMGILSIFVNIRNGQLINFVPFINIKDKSIKNIFVSTIDKLKKYLNMAESHNKKWGPPQDQDKMILDKCIIYGFKYKNNDLFNNVQFFYYPLYFDMFWNFLRDTKTNLTSMFFVNIFDHPIIKKTILSTNKLLSNDTQSSFSDIAFPYADIWMNFSPEKITDVPITNHYTSVKNMVTAYLSISHEKLFTMFNQRKKMMIFRGKLTGCYPENAKNNLRLCAVKTVYQIPNYKKYYNVGLSNLYNGIIVENHIYHKDDDLKNDIELLRKDYPELVKYVSGPLQLQELLSGYQFALSIDGFVSAWRLPYELLMGNVVFICSNYTTWFSDLLVDGINCIKVHDLSLLHNKYMALYHNVNLCRQISMEANLLGKKLFTKEFIYQKLFQSISVTK